MNNYKTLAAISYITIFGTIIAFFLNNDKRHAFTYFHVRQALGLWLSFFALGYFIGYFNNWIITFAFWISIGILLFYGFFSALQGNATPVPFVGKLYQNIFKTIGSEPHE